MKYTIYLVTLIFLMESCSNEENRIAAVNNKEKQPNILLVMVDDMRFTDTQPYGAEISTPTIQKLAKNGMMFTDFHTSVSCSPTRSMLLSGTDNHLAGLGNMGELLTPNQIGQPGYEGHLNNNVVSLAEVLNESGYHTYMGGKWHLGHGMNSIPGARGFEKSFSLLNGGASHFDDMAGLAPSEHVEYTLNGKKIEELPKDFYSTRSFTDFVMNSIREQKDDKPFFAYLAYSAPHDPLHVPEPWMSKYKGVYDEGYEKLRTERILNAKQLGLIPTDAKVPAMNQTGKSWNSLSEEEKEMESRYMEVYAGMVENVDYHMGRMLDFLSDIRELDNTIILFLSDNGSNPWDNSMYPGNGDDVYLSQFDNRLENIGNPTSHTAYGIGWASAGSGPLDYFKMTAGEGGIRTPMIISGPNVSKDVIHRKFVYITDIMPTLLEMVGIEHPDTYNGNKVLKMRGKPFSKVLSKEETSLYTDSEYIAGEMQNGKWIRKGDYKAVFIPKPYGPQQWKLYDLSVDPGETTDLSEQKPDLIKELITNWEKYAEEVGVIPM